ncbi:SMAD/FHA domain-containing protein [Gautieria morchelliformis]|nr:SMAD/FHA domain-containing protein [Gautieria morchelliformis]
MPATRSRSPPRRGDRYPEIPRSRRDRGYEGRSGRGRREDDRDDRYERTRDRRDRNSDRGGPRREESPPSRKYNENRSGPSSRPRSVRPPSHHSKSRSRSKSVETQPNFNPSGLLAAETNTVTRSDGTSTFLKYNEPPEARRPSQGWRLYVFKGKEQVDLLHIHRQSVYLVGRDRVVSDIPIEHPSCSKQHAAIQFRHVAEQDDLGNVKAAVKPFIIDLESTNGTLVNDETIPTSRYYELKPSDVIKFGESLREYVLLHDDA